MKLFALLLTLPLLPACGGGGSDGAAPPTSRSASAAASAAADDAVTDADGARCRLFLRSFQDYAEAVKALPDRVVNADDRQLLEGFAQTTTEFAEASNTRLKAVLAEVAKRAHAAAQAIPETGRIDFKVINDAIDRVQEVCADAPPPGS